MFKILVLAYARSGHSSMQVIEFTSEHLADGACRRIIAGTKAAVVDQFTSLTVIPLYSRLPDEQRLPGDR